MRTHTVLLAIGAAALVSLPATLLATTSGYSIGLNFGADEYPTDPIQTPAPGALAPGDVAGVPGVTQANWNNLVTNDSSNVEILVADSQGNAVDLPALYVQWTSANTWASAGRGDDNFFPTNSADFKLLTGYLDTTDTSTNSIYIQGLPGELTSGYDVYVYMLATANRGGGYRILDGSGNVLKDFLLGTIAPDTTEYVRDPGLDHVDAGNYLVFRGLTASTIEIQSTCSGGLGFGGTFRAPINAIQLVAAPRDTAAPTVPAGLTSDLTGARLARMSWTGSTDAGLVHYELLRDGQVVGSTAATNIEDRNLHPESPYSYTVRAVDDSGNRSAESSPLAVTTGAEVEAIAVTKDEIYLDVPATATAGTIANLAFDPLFPDSPDQVLYRLGTEGPGAYGDNYASRLSGWITPSESGNYVFYLSSDDQSELYLSTDATPANKKLIAVEPQWNNARQWVLTDRRTAATPENRSDTYTTNAWGNTITLQAGTKYYFEIIHAEGGSGDNVGFTWAKEGVAVANGDAPVLSEQLTALVDPVDASVNITQQPVAKSAIEGTPVTFNLTADFTSPYVAAPGYQWFRNGAPIVGARAASYTSPDVTAADNGALYKCLVVVPSAYVYSDEVALTVTDDTTPPRVSKVVAAGVSALTVTFNEPIDAVSALIAGNYAVSDGVTVSGVTQLDASRVRVSTSVLTSEAQYSLTVTGVQDRFGNPSVGAPYSFVARILGYRDIIVADAPIAYYRFEETSGTVALNDGTSGRAGDGVYKTGDEPSDVEHQAKTAEGPRPPEFFGFDPANRAASFGGPAVGLQDWVDTQNQFLQGLGSFSLEYWVHPEGGRLDTPSGWGTRIGIVGQNDAIEYGFIDQNTIQIWTPGGGALDTDYLYPDNEWHHVATIASGPDIRNYFDGVLVGTGGSAVAAGGNYGTSTYNVHIGGAGVFDTVGNYFIGRIDEVAIFDKAIPAERIAAHYSAALGDFILPEPGYKFTAITVSGDQVTLEWEGGGTLQESADLTAGSWSDAADQSNPQTITAAPGAASKFYRIRE